MFQPSYVLDTLLIAVILVTVHAIRPPFTLARMVGQGKSQRTEILRRLENRMDRIEFKLENLTHISTATLLARLEHLNDENAYNPADPFSPRQPGGPDPRVNRT
jgi:hypothetical protein